MAQNEDRRHPRGGAVGSAGSKRGLVLGLVALVVVGLAGVGAVLFFSESTTSEVESTPADAPLAVPVLTATQGRQLYVAPDGLPGNPGTERQPVDLATALSANTPAAPGDLIWLRGGTYSGHFTSSLTGTEGEPIRVRQYVGERATLTGTNLISPVLTAGGSWTWFSDFEITMAPSAYEAEKGGEAVDLRQGGAIVVRGANLSFTNLIIHDVPKGIDIARSPGALVSGNLIYHVGLVDSTLGVGIKTTTENGDHYILDNIVFNQGAGGIAVSMTPAERLQLEGNISFNNGVSGEFFDRNLLIEGGTMNVARNYTYYRLGRRGGENAFGYRGGCTRIDAFENYLVARESYPLVLSKCDGIIKSNTFVGPVDTAWVARYPENTVVRQDPTGLRTFVRPNRHDPDRFTVVVFNWDKYPAVNVDISDAKMAPGTAYEIRDAQDYFGELVATGIYEGGRLNISMTGRKAAAPVRLPVASGHTAPEFAVFILTKVPAPAPAASTQDQSPR